MIEYVEVREKTSRKLIGVIDTAQSVIWRTVYFGVGEFEVYVAATPRNIELLKIGNLVTRNGDVNCGIISNIVISDDAQNGRMIAASGKFAKTILSWRVIHKFVKTYSVTPLTLSGEVADAVRGLIDKNCGTQAPGVRRFDRFTFNPIYQSQHRIVDDFGYAARKQVTYDNLLTYTDELLREYGMGAYIWLDNFSLDFCYAIYEGVDRTIGNAVGNKPLIFSQEFDNLTSTTYAKTDELFASTAIIGGEGEGLERFVGRIGDTVSGYNRREIFVDSSGTTKTVKNDNDEDVTYTDAEYAVLLIQDGKSVLETQKVEETLAGTIDLTNSSLKYREDFSVGDLVTVQESSTGRYINTRLLAIVEVQDENGYHIDIEYGNDNDE